jgi:hypothetical protein
LLAIGLLERAQPVIGQLVDGRLCQRLFVFVVAVAVGIAPRILAHFDDGRGRFVDQVPNETGHKGQSAHDAVRVRRSDRLGCKSVGYFVNVELVFFIRNLSYKLLVTGLIEREKKT